MILLALCSVSYIASHSEGVRVCVLRTASLRIIAKHGGAVDPSLVKTCKRSKEVHRQYRLGMGSWTESSSEDEKETLPPKGKSLKLKKPPCKRSKEVHRQNPLGMGSWTESSIEDEKENLPPNGKSLKTSHRWSFITDQDKEELSERHVPKNTEATASLATAFLATASLATSRAGKF